MPLVKQGASGAVALLVAAAVAGCSPTPDSGTPAVNGGWACGWQGCSYYLDRPTTHRWAKFFQKWDKATDAPAAFATAYCARFGMTAAGVCAAGMIGMTSMLVDHLNEADAMHGCLEFQIFDVRNPSGVLIDAYNGEHCTG
jgi:hypothetical protein